MKGFKFKNFFFLLLLGLLIVFPSAFSSWIVYDVDGSTLINTATLEPVCYIDSDTDANKYYSIEKALSKAMSGQTVYVIPNTNPTIKYDCTIKSGVTLTIGGLTKDGSYIKDGNGNYVYADRGVFDEQNDTSNENSAANRGPHLSSNNFADYDDVKGVAVYRKNLVTLDAALTILSNGTLNIAGRLGVETQGLSGMTSGDYCEILLTSKGSIENNGKIDCYGFIKQKEANSNAFIYNYNGSSVYQPFIICDFNGGTYSATCNQKDDTKVMPFNQWLMCNIQVKQVFEYNSILMGYYDVYNGTYQNPGNLNIVIVKKGHKYGQINVIGSSNSIININNGGRVEILTETDNINNTTFVSYIVNKHLVINFYGSCEIEKMLIPNPMPDLDKVSGLTNIDVGDADSSLYFFGLCHYFAGNIYGTLTVKTKQKVLPGCNVYVKEGGTLNINADSIVYEDFDEQSSGATKVYKYPVKFNQNKDYSSVRNAIINDGTINVNGCSFGGKIYSNNENAILNFSGSSSLSVISREMASGSMNVQKFPPKVTFTPVYQSPDKTEVARGPLVGPESIAVSNFSSTVYVSSSLNDEIGWKLATDLDSYSITYHLNGGSTSVDDGFTGTYYMVKDSSLTLTSVPIPSPTKQYYDFYGWYLDSSFTTNISDGVTVSNGTNVNVYAKYVDRDYSITYKISNDTGLSANITNPNESLTSINKTIFDNNGGSIAISECISDNELLEFDGWYTKEDFSLVSKLENNLIVELGDYVLFGRFVKIRPKVTFEGISLNGINTFTVGEDGTIPLSTISELSNYLSGIKENSDLSTYIETFTYNGNQYTINQLQCIVFTENSTVVANSLDKYFITYNNLASTQINKYYVRDSSGVVIGNPIISDLTGYENDDRKCYQWDYNGNRLDNLGINNYLNDNISANNISLNMVWKYKLTIIVNSCGSKGVQISSLTIGNQTFSSVGTKEYYVPTNETISFNIDGYFSGKKTKVVWSTPSDSSKDFSISNGGLWQSGSRSIEMPEGVSIVTITSG